MVTSEMLGSIRERSILSDVFFLFGSLAGGAYFSIVISLAASVGLDDTTIAVMQTYRMVAGWLTLGFIGAGFYFLCMTYYKIGAVKKNKLVTDEDTAPSEQGGRGKGAEDILLD